MIAIDTFNQIYRSLTSIGSALPSAQEWICKLYRGSMYNPIDQGLFYSLTTSRVVNKLNALKVEELDGLERIVCGVESKADAEIAKTCARAGILVESQCDMKFSSPVMWQLFVRKRACLVRRARRGPKTLQEMIESVVRSINFDTIRHALHKRIPGDDTVENFAIGILQGHCSPQYF